MLNLPTIPTDSLYKFLFVGGLILIIAAFTFSDRRLNSMRTDPVHQKIDSLDYANSQIIDDHATKTRFIATVISQLNNKDTSQYAGCFLPKIYFLYQDSLQTSPSFRKNFGMLNTYQTNDDTVIIHLKKNIASIRVMLKKLQVYEEDIYMPEITKITNRRKMYEEKNQELMKGLKIFNVYIFTAGSLGVLFALFGAIMWYIKIQKPTDENQIMQIEQLKENLEIQKTNSSLDTEIKRLQIEQMKKANPA